MLVSREMKRDNPELAKEKEDHNTTRRHFVRLYRASEAIRLLLIESGADVPGIEEALLLAHRLLKAQMRECRILKGRVERGD